MYFIHNNKCRFKDSQCNYSHRRQDLTWSDEELAEQLSKKLDERKGHLRSKKEEHKLTKTRQRPTPSLPKPPLPPSPGQSQTRDTQGKTTKKPRMRTNPPPYVVGVSTYPPRWEMPQQLDRLQLLQYGLLNWVSRTKFDPTLH